MDISVVIRCGDDWRVLDCINSIDEDVEVVVALSENPELERRLAFEGIKYCLTPRHNLSMTSNIGIENTSHDRVIITDSDTTFDPGCITELNRYLEEYPVVRARLRFASDHASVSSGLISAARDYVNSLPLVYTPGVALRKDVIARIGGFAFNEDVPYAVDADLNYRIRASGTPVKFSDQATINHSAESLKHDLKAAHRIGWGCAASYNSLKNVPQFSTIRWYDLKGVPLNHLPDLLAHKGSLVLAYQVAWDAAYWLGYLQRKLNGA